MILVVLFHVSQHHEYTNLMQKTIYYIFGNGFLGVEMFFLLSAYGLCYSYDNNTLKKFYYNRFTRLIPLYPIALIIGYIKAGTPIKQAVTDFLQQISGIALFTDTLDILWYIEALILLYIFFPLLFSFCQWIYKLSNIGLVLAICALFHFILIFIPDYWLQMSIGRVPMIIIGVMTFLYDRDNNKKALYLLYGGLTLMAVMPVFKEMYFFVPASLLLIADSKKCYGEKIICFIGMHTYEIFIAHHFALWSFGHVTENYYITLSVIFFLIIIYSN